MGNQDKRKVKKGIPAMKAFWGKKLQPFLFRYLYFTIYTAGLLFFLFIVIRNFLKLEGFQGLTNDDIESLSVPKLLLKVILSSPLHQNLAVSLLLVLFWVIVFAIIPLGIKNLSRVKVFNFEMEVGNETEKIETLKDEVVDTLYPAKMMKFFSEDEVYNYIFDVLWEESLKPEDEIREFNEVYISLLSEYLEETANQYKQHYGSTFDYEIICEPTEEKLDPKIMGIWKKAIHSEEGVFINPKGGLWPKKNYFISLHSFDDQEYVTILSSYAYTFRSSDDYLFSMLHNILVSNIDRAHNAIALNSITLESALEVDDELDVREDPYDKKIPGQ